MSKKIEVDDLSNWQNDRYTLDAEAVADVLNKLQARVERLERESGRCQCMHCVVIGPHA